MLCPSLKQILKAQLGLGQEALGLESDHCFLKCVSLCHVFLTGRGLQRICHTRSIDRVYLEALLICPVEVWFLVLMNAFF